MIAGAGVSACPAGTTVGGAAAVAGVPTYKRSTTSGEPWPGPKKQQYRRPSRRRSSRGRPMDGRSRSALLITTCTAAPAARRCGRCAGFTVTTPPVTALSSSAPDGAPRCFVCCTYGGSG